MNKLIENIQGLAEVYGWKVEGPFDWHFNAQRDNFKMSIYWNKKGEITIVAKKFNNVYNWSRHRASIGYLESVLKDQNYLKNKVN